MGVREARGVGPTLLAVPPSLLRTWEKELKSHIHFDTLRYWKYHGSKRSNGVLMMFAYDIVLTTYHVVALKRRDFDNWLKPLHSHSWYHIVLDEGRSEHQPVNMKANVFPSPRDPIWRHHAG